MPSTAARFARAAATLMLVAAPATAKDCNAACTLFENSNQKYLIHEAKMQCKKHNVSPRPTTEDICLSTFRAITHSSCLVYCDPTQHSYVPDACGAIAGTTWIPKHNAFRSCKTGYKAATQAVPRLVSEAADRMPTLRDLLEAAEKPKFKAVKSQEFKFERADKKAEAITAAAEAASAEAAAAEAARAADAAAAAAEAAGASEAEKAAALEAAKAAEAAATEAAKAEAHLAQAEAAVELSPEEEAELADEFVFPVTIDDGSVVDLVVKASDNLEEKVAVFCGEHMSEEEGCADQLLPIVKERMAEEQPAR